MKKIFSILILILIFYIGFVIYEVKRFENNIGIEPFFLISKSVKEVSLQNKDGYKKYVEYVGLGYNVLYEYVIYDEDYEIYDSNVIYLSGEFRLVDKIMLSAWIQ